MAHAVVAVPVALALLLSGCAAGVDTPGSADAPAPVAASPEAANPEASAAAPASSAPAAPSTPPSTPPSTTPTPQVRTIEVRYSGGQVTGTSGREEVRLGQQVVLRIASDVAEEVHVHGYDLQAAVAAGGSTDIPLQASIPGVFEVELHESGKVLYQLRVA